MRIRIAGGLLTVLMIVIYAAVAAAADGDGGHEAARYGEYRLVEDKGGGLWTREQWLGKTDAGPEAKLYGYMADFDGFAATVWTEAFAGGVAGRELVVFDRPLPIRDLHRYFGAVQRLAAGSEVYVSAGYPREQLAVLARGGDGVGRLILFHFDNRRDTTRPNTHSLVRGFEIRRVPVCGGGDMVKEGNIMKLAGEWRKTDNFFAPGLHFSERLIARKGTDLIVIHHTKIPGMTVEDIHDLHLKNGWAGIGYHKVVLPDGSVTDGRPEQAVGAHALGVNKRSVGIVAVGDFDAAPPSPAQLSSLVAVTATIAAKYGVAPDRIVPHRGVFRDTTCPGRLFPWEEFFSAVRATK